MIPLPFDILSQYRCPRLTLHAFILFCHLEAKIQQLLLCMHFLWCVCTFLCMHYLFNFIDTCLKRELFKKRKLLRFRWFLLFWPCVEICALSPDSGWRCHVKLIAWNIYDCSKIFLVHWLLHEKPSFITYTCMFKISFCQHKTHKMKCIWGL